MAADPDSLRNLAAEPAQRDTLERLRAGQWAAVDQDAALTWAQALPAGPEQTHVMIRRLSDLARDRETAQGMFELAPHALRDPILRARFAALYAYYRSTMLERAGMAQHLKETPAYEDRQDILALPALVMAVIDGMSLQVNLDPAAVDIDRVFALLDLLVTEVLEGRLHTGGKLAPPDTE